MTGLVVGIPSYNEESNISFVTQVIDKGIQELYRHSFAPSSTLIVNADNNSNDGTKEAFLQTTTIAEKIYVPSGGHLRGKGFNIANIFRIATDRESHCMLFDADLKSISPNWIIAYWNALVTGFEFVTPNYIRYKNSAGITNHICYPLFTGILNSDIRQPIGGDFAFSSSFTKNLDSILDKKEIEDPVFKFGIDSFVSCHAVLQERKICRVNLGAKIHREKNPARDLDDMFIEEMAVICDLICDNASKILSMGQTISLIESQVLINAKEIKIDKHELSMIARQKYSIHKDNFLAVFQKSTLQNATPNVDKPELVNITPGTWRDIVFDAIVAYKNCGKYALELLLPFFYCRILSFIDESRHVDDIGAEILIKQNSNYFFESRQQLIARLLK